MGTASLPAPAPIDLLAWAVERTKRGRYNFKKCATRELGRPHLEDVAAALVSAEGSVACAADLLGIGRQQLHNYIGRTPDIQDLRDQYRESVLDRVERNVYKRALKGDWKAQRFILSTLGRERGYGNRTTIEHEDAGQLRELLERAEKSHGLPGEIIDVTPNEEANSNAAQAPHSEASAPARVGR